MVITIKEPGKPTKEMAYDSELSPFDKTKKEKIDKPTEDLAPQAPPRDPPPAVDGDFDASILENYYTKNETNSKIKEVADTSNKAIADSNKTMTETNKKIYEKIELEKNDRIKAIDEINNTITLMKGSALDKNGNIVDTSKIPENIKEITETQYKELEITLTDGSKATINLLSSANIYTDIVETIELGNIMSQSQALMAGITFQYLPLKNKFLLGKNTIICPLSALNPNFGDFNCQVGIYKLVNINNENYLEMIAASKKGRISHGKTNFFVGDSIGLKIDTIKENILSPSKNFYYIGVLSNYRADMLGNNYWYNLDSNLAPTSTYHFNPTNFNYNDIDLNDKKYSLIKCSTTNSQTNYIRIFNEE